MQLAMTEEQIFEILSGIDAELDSHGRFFFFSRGREFQEAARDSIKAIGDRVKPLLLESQKNGYEDTSNRLRALLCQLDALVAELQMYLHLKDDNMSAAWDSLISAQDGMLWAMRAHPVFCEGLKGHASRLDAIERILFPRQVFFSTGMIVKASECSICGKEYRDCEHIKGRIYNGEFCTRGIKDCELQEVSVVEDPADKRCRAHSFGEGTVMRDILTWRKIEGSEQDGGGQPATLPK